MRSLADICRDRTSGAATLYRQVLELFLGDARYRTAASRKKAIIRLRDSFPEMAVFVYLETKLTGAGREEIESLPARLLEEARREPQAVVGHLKRIWRARRRVVTVSQSSVVKEVLAACRGRISGVLLSEAAPRREGIDMARFAADLGLSVELTADAALPGRVRKGDYVIVGADCVTEKYIVNKTGTLPLFLAAKRAGARTVVVFERFKRVSSKRFAFAPKQHRASEILSRRYRGITVHNNYFETTPLDLCDYLISGAGAENGAKK